MLEIIVIGLIFWIGYEVGTGVTAYRLRHLIFKEANRLGLFKEIELDDTPIVEQLYVEKTNDTLLELPRETPRYRHEGDYLWKCRCGSGGCPFYNQ
jgi:hypothetical protein